MPHNLFLHSAFCSARVWAFLNRVDAAEAENCRSWAGVSVRRWFLVVRMWRLSGGVRGWQCAARVRADGQAARSTGPFDRDGAHDVLEPPPGRQVLGRAPRDEPGPVLAAPEGER